MNRSQLTTMLWLRWRLTRNQWRRGGELNLVISMIVAAIGLSLAVAGGIGGVVGGALGLAQASPLVTMLVWDGLVLLFLLLWVVGIVTELQRSELIDLGRLLHLPVSLPDVFLLNYVASHFRLSLAVFVPTMLGLAVGLSLGRGPSMALLVLPVLAFFFMITAWTYCLRGWLASLMVNQRRRRAVIMGVTMAFILLAQMPNLVMNVWLGGRHRNRAATQTTAEERAATDRQEKAQWLAVLDQAHRYVPVLWLPQAAGSLARGDSWPALGGGAVMVLFGALGLARAYRSTLRFYQAGDTKKPIPAPRAARPVRAGGRILVERRLPVIPEEAAALALASFRSLIRAPEVKMTLATNLVVFGVLGAGMLVRRTGTLPEAVRPFMASGAVIVTFLGLMQPLFNQFGFDRDGFRALVLLPSERRHMLLGKNLALLPFALVLVTVFLAAITALAHVPVLAVLAAGLQFGAAYLALSTLGNLASILMPYRIAPGSLKPTKTKATTQALIVGLQMLSPLAMVLILLPAGLGLLCEYLGWLPAAAVNLAGSALLAALAALLYWRTLAPLGALLQRREQKILQVVTQEVE